MAQSLGAQGEKLTEGGGQGGIHFHTAAWRPTWTEGTRPGHPCGWVFTDLRLQSPRGSSCPSSQEPHEHPTRLLRLLRPPGPTPTSTPSALVERSSKGPGPGEMCQQRGEVTACGLVRGREGLSTQPCYSLNQLGMSGAPGAITAAPGRRPPPSPPKPTLLWFCSPTPETFRHPPPPDPWGGRGLRRANSLAPTPDKALGFLEPLETPSESGSLVR